MKTFYVLYLLVGGGVGNFAWGGPAIMRFDDLAECLAASKALESQHYVLTNVCLLASVAPGVPQ
ncbi:hypothetical protein [Hyphomicrobium sp.]|uniref:hypothetical protein n=1 Tax=Hyphomicrobium sp. TaxID=82 RepID=UPI001DD4F5D0|nr:hypothetical protein [Hyphomicrobium sp.]MBY0561448.1 hypothetical protein [Hyphomicrobium sp.]